MAIFLERPLRSARTRLARRVRSLPGDQPWAVATTTLVFYLAILVPLVSIRGADSLAHVGSTFTKMSDRSGRISSLRPTARVGYDGQFAYFIALDPLKARYHMDRPSYRYGRVLYPAAAWVGAFGQPGALPYALLAVNLLAIVGTVWLLASHLRRRGASSWWAAVYGFFPGLMFCLFADLTEPLAYLLATGALILLLERKPPPIGWAGLLFALAALTRETTLVFAFIGASWLVVGRRAGRRFSAVHSAGLLAVTTVLPYAGYRFLLERWLGTGLQEGDELSLKPFEGFTTYELDDPHQLILFIVIVPALIWLGLAAWSALRSRFDVAVALLAANVALFIVWLPPDAYGDLRSAYRVLIPIVISALLILPTLRQHLRDDLVLSAVLSLTFVWGIIGAWFAEI